MPDSWHEGRLCAFDLETTAADPLVARIVTACVAHVGAGLQTEQRTWLVDPGIEIPEAAAAIHGITTERARRDGMPTVTAVAEIATALKLAWGLGEPVVIFNASYDLTVLDRELRRNALKPLDVGSVIDPFVIDKRVDRYRRGKRTLTAMCEVYRVVLDGAHDAAFDAIAAARLAYRMAKSIAAIGAPDLATLHQLQAVWYAEQAASLEEYFRRTGKNETCNREWPIRRAPDAAHVLEVG